jgi:DMSO/TMAO reductase YedYZ molybdopterin-dependent catalytic subunit
MLSRRAVILFVVAFALGGQEPTAAIQVTGAVRQALKLTTDDLAKMDRASVQTKTDAGVMNYEGVWLHEVLKRAGVPAGAELRGKAVASYLLAEAKDGYQVVFSLAELDPAFIDDQVLLADKVNGKPLDDATGPFRLIAPKEKRAARSIRMLTKLEVVLLRK